MTLFQDTVGDPRARLSTLADVLVWYGAVADAAAGNAAGFGRRKASLAVSLASIANADEHERDALYCAGILHAIGTIGNRAFVKDQELGERLARMERWDVPAQGARACAAIGALPPATADLVRWQAECWDGTGYPDQLRWHGIPPACQYLAIADAFLRSGDPEEALGAINMQSGRAFGPEHARTFTTWFHTNAGELEPMPPPLGALDAAATSAEVLLETIADAVDAHNGTPGRWRRVAALAENAAHAVGANDDECRALALAVRICGTGELVAETIEDTTFDPLARMGLEERARNAHHAASFAADIPSFAPAAAIVAARAEWFDGTGKPAGLRAGDIPLPAQILGAALAYDRIDRTSRMDEAAGTQFAPAIVRALMQLARQHA